jgi:hypothetical protein
MDLVSKDDQRGGTAISSLMPKMLNTEAGIFRTRVIVLALVGACTQASPPALHAACLPPPPPCEALQKAFLVVLADVLETGSGELIPPFPLRPQTVRLRVVERFKGVAPDQTEIRASIENQSDGVRLTAGRMFIVYVNEQQSHRQNVWITACSRTKPADEESSEEVRELRQCKSR